MKSNSTYMNTTYVQMFGNGTNNTAVTAAKEFFV